MASKTKSQIEDIALNLTPDGRTMNAGRLRAILIWLNLRVYKTNWGVLKAVRGAYKDAVNRGDLIAAHNIKYAFVCDNGRYAWKK